jgi:hypothetical protein
MTKHQYQAAFCEQDLQEWDNYRLLLVQYPYTGPVTDRETRLGIAEVDEKAKQLEQERLINEPLSTEEKIFVKRKTERSDD